MNNLIDAFEKAKVISTGKANWARSEKKRNEYRAQKISNYTEIYLRDGFPPEQARFRAERRFEQEHQNDQRSVSNSK